MKKKKVIAMLLVGTMALSSPLSVIASDVSIADSIEFEEENGDIETVQEEVIDNENQLSEVEDDDINILDDNLTDNYNNDDGFTDGTDINIDEQSATKINPTCIAVFSNGTYADIEVSDDSISLDGYKLDIREITGDQKIETNSTLASKESVLMFDLEVKDSNDNDMLLSDDNIVKMTMDDMSFLEGSILCHKQEDGTWEEIEYTYSHNQKTNEYEITFPGKTFGVFSFVKEQQNDITVDNQNDSSDKEDTSSKNEDFSSVENVNSFSWSGGITGNDVNINVNSGIEFPQTDNLHVAELPKNEIDKKISKINEISGKDVEALFPIELEICNENDIEDSMDETYKVSINGFTAIEGSSLYHELLNGTFEKVVYDINDEGTTFTSNNGLGIFIFVKEKEQINNTDMELKNENYSDVNTTNKKDYTFEDEDVAITATVNEESKIPETAELKVKRLEEGSDAYNAALEEVEKSISLANNQKLLFMAYDIYFINEGEKIEPVDGEVQVKMVFKKSLFGISPKNDEIFAAHVKDDGIVEKVSNTAEEKDTLSFAVSSFSIMGPAMISELNDDEESDEVVSPIIIDRFETRFTSGASLKDGKYVYNPSESAAGHSFVYTVNYTMSGTFSTDAGAFKIEFPLHILKDRDGNWADTFECPYLCDSEITDTDNPDFVYSIDEDNNIATIYNYKPYPTGESGYIEVSYTTSKSTISYIDMAPSEKLHTKIYATNTASTVTSEAEADEVYIDTHATISYTQKKTPTLYNTWQSSWGEKPENADDYLYLIWPIRTYINKNTAPYNFYLNDTFSDLDGSVVGYRFAGQNQYTDVDHIDNVTSYGDRYDYVLTRHSKTKAQSKIDEIGKYEVHNDIQATVSPYDHVDENTTAKAGIDWKYEKPKYAAPNGYFAADKNGLYAGNNTVYNDECVTDYTLGEFIDGEEDSIKNIRYYTYGTGYPYPWTLGDGADKTVNDAINGLYGQKKVDYSFTDDTFYVEGNKLNADDYDISSVEWTPTMRSAVFQNESLTFIATPITKFEETDNISILAKVDEQWIQVAVYDMLDKIYKDINESYVSSTSGMKLNFNAGIKGIRFTATNSYYYTSFAVYPNITLNRTDNVLNLCGDKTKICVKNEANFKISQEENVIYNKIMYGMDYIQKVKRESEIKKDIIQTKNVKRNARYDVTWRIAAQETYVDNTGLHYIMQNGCKFYDLIPAGSVLNPETIQINASGNVLNVGEYNYETIDNFRDSGRTLLIVSITESADKYVMTYMTSNSYSAIADYGKNLLNSVAYESGNDKIGEGFPDDGGNITDKDVLKNLDSDSDEERFLYAEARFNINMLLAANTGLKKQIKNNSSLQYAYETTVHLGESYSYQIRLANDAITKSKNVIFFDSLENFYQKSSESSPTIPSDWKGTLTGVNVNNLIFKGANPKVYLSKFDNLNIQNHHDLNELIESERLWMPYDEFVEKYGLENAHAIAVDVSKSINGSDFVLDEKKSMSFEIYMKAPDIDVSESNDPIAYNNIYVSRMAVSENDEDVAEIPQFFHQDYTKAHYRVAGDVELKKVDETDTQTAIKGITYRLSGTSDYGTEYFEERVSDKNGIMRYETIEKGTYELREISCSDDWQLNMETYIVKIDEKGEAIIDNLTKIEDVYLVSDKPRIHADLTFLKYNSVTNGMIKNVRFRLSGTSDYGNDYLLYETSNEIGRVDFENIELGTYELTEIEVPDGYIKKKEPWTVKVDERGAASIYYGDTEERKTEAGYYALANEPYHSIRFVKSSTYGDNIYLEGAEFSLTGVSDYGTSVEKTAASGKAEDGGLVVFDGLEPGTYILKETKAPEEHDLNERPYIVKVNKDGTFTIEGLEKVTFGTKSVAYSLLDDNAKVDSEENTSSLITDVEEKLTEETQSENINKKTISILDEVEQNADTEN